MAGAARLAGALGGKGLGAIGAGLLVGVIGSSALVASGAVSFAGDSGRAAGDGSVIQLVSCPGRGPVLGTIPRGQEVLVTGRSADGGWLQLYYPAPGIERAWIKAGPLVVDGEVGSLPVEECEAPPTASPRPTAEPTPTSEATPTPSPTTEPTPTPTVGTNAGPKVSGLAASRSTISYDTGSYCAGSPTSTVISVSASDADGVEGVTLFFRRPGTSTYASKAMTLAGGKWTATLDTTGDSLKTAGQLRYYVMAKDKNPSPAESKSPKAGALELAIKVCQNAGPKFTRGPSLSAATLYWDPLGVGRCQTATNVLATVSDPQGVAKVELFFRRPGQSSWSKKAMALRVGQWFANLDTLGDKIPITSPPADTIAWYVKATDKKGASTSSKVKSIPLKRCDTEATRFGASAPGEVPVGGSCGTPKIAINLWFYDADGPAKTGVVVKWSLSGKGLSGSAAAVRTGLDGDLGLYRASLATKSSWVPPVGSRYTLSYSIISRDDYGGTTDSRSSTKFATITIYHCP